MTFPIDNMMTENTETNTDFRGNIMEIKIV